MRNLYLILFVLNLVYTVGNAQQTPLFSQYVLNEFIINPSAAGVDGMTSVSLTGRKQWLGWEFAPETYSASASTRILKSRSPFVRKKRPGASSIKKGATGRVGLGASIIKDRNGAINKTTINLTYAYHIPINNSQLSFGLSFLTNQYRIDDEFAKLSDPSDPINGLIGTSTYSPDASIGFNFSTHKYHVGFSVFNLFQSPVKFGKSSVNYKQLKQVRHYYILGTYRSEFPSNNEWEYEPSIIARGTEKLQGSADIGVRFIYEKEYWFGFSYRTSGDIIALLGVKLNRFYLGYSFDYGFSEISRYTYGSHEIIIAIKIGDSARRYRYWQRY